MKNIFLSIIGLAFVVSIVALAEEAKSGQILQPGCLVAGEAISVNEDFDGKPYIKIKICEYKDVFDEAGRPKSVLLPTGCFTQDELDKFLDSIKKTPQINKTMWEFHLTTLGFKDLKDLEKKLSDFKKDNSYEKQFCMSGKITKTDNETDNANTIRRSTDHIADYFNELYKRNPMSLNSGTSPPKHNAKPTLDAQ